MALNDRRQALLVDYIEALRVAFAEVKRAHPFDIDAIVILPEHLHCIWTLPAGDDDFSMRWRQIKSAFSRRLPNGEWRSESRQSKGERGIWHRRFWEHVIRDDEDFARHVDYIHYNPVKHGWVSRVSDWPYSTFGRYVERGVYAASWGDDFRETVIEAGE
ncbi:MAG: transposase [Methylomicrobium sp.]